jgi:hypothetical protein
MERLTVTVVLVGGIIWESTISTGYVQVASWPIEWADQVNEEWHESVMVCGLSTDEWGAIKPDDRRWLRLGRK